MNDHSNNNSNDNQQVPSRQPKDKARREIIKKTLTGGALAGTAVAMIPANWSRPVVQSVLLPAHAQTSEQSPEPDTEPDGNFTFEQRILDGRLPRWLNWLVPTVHAQTGTCPIRAGCAKLSNEEFTFYVFGECCCNSASGRLGDTIPGEAFAPIDCGSGEPCNMPSIELVSLSGEPGSRTLTVSVDGGSEIELPETVDNCGCGTLTR